MWENHPEGEFKCNGGDDKEGRLCPSETTRCTASVPRRGSSSLKHLEKTQFLNPDPLTHCSGPESIAWVKIDCESSWALLDSSATINSVTLKFIQVCSLDVGPLSDLSDGTLGTDGFGGVKTQLLGYVIIIAQVEGVRGYDKDQVALVKPDSTTFGPSTSCSGCSYYQ